MGWGSTGGNVFVSYDTEWVFWADAVGRQVLNVRGEAHNVIEVAGSVHSDGNMRGAWRTGDDQPFNDTGRDGLVEVVKQYGNYWVAQCPRKSDLVLFKSEVEALSAARSMDREGCGVHRVFETNLTVDTNVSEWTVQGTKVDVTSEEEVEELRESVVKAYFDNIALVGQIEMLKRSIDKILSGSKL